MNKMTIKTTLERKTESPYKTIGRGLYKVASTTKSILSGTVHITMGLVYFSGGIFGYAIMGGIEKLLEHYGVETEAAWRISIGAMAGLMGLEMYLGEAEIEKEKAEWHKYPSKYLYSEPSKEEFETSTKPIGGKTK